MFAIKIVLGEIAASTIAVGIVAGTVSVILMVFYKHKGWLENDDLSSTSNASGASKNKIKKFV